MSKLHDIKFRVFFKKYFNYKDADEKFVWEMMLNGDKLALEAIYVKYVHILYNYGVRLVTESQIVEDAIQDLFINLAIQRGKICMPSSIRFYLLKSLRNELFSKLKKIKAVSISEDFFVGERVNLELPHENILIEKQNASFNKVVIENLINKLPPRQGEAIYLRFYEDLSYQNIASILNINQKSVYKLVYKALKNLKKKNFFLCIFLLMIVVNLCRSL